MMAILTHGLQSSLLQLRMIISCSGVRSQEESWKRCCSSCRTLNEGLGLLRRAISNLGQFNMPSSFCLECNKVSQTICDTWCTFDNYCNSTTCSCFANDHYQWGWSHWCHRTLSNLTYDHSPPNPMISCKSAWPLFSKGCRTLSQSHRAAHLLRAGHGFGCCYK